MNKEPFGVKDMNSANKADRQPKPNYHARRMAAAAIASTMFLGTVVGAGVLGYNLPEHETHSFEMTVGDDPRGVIDDIQKAMEGQGLDPARYPDLVETGQDIQGALSATGDPAATSGVEIKTYTNGLGWNEIGYQFPGDKAVKIER